MDPDRVLEGLDPEQTQVARALRGPVCVLAGAGTGKTRAITHRIAHAVASGVVAEQQVLAVTFTARAAGEMRGRLRTLGAPRVQARTFHSAALRQLSYFWPDAVGGEKPTLIDSKIKAVAQAAHMVGLQPDRTGLRDLASEIEWAKVTQVRPTDYEKAVAKAGRDTPTSSPQEVSRVFEAYEDLCRERNLLDFESMLELTAGMINADPGIAQKVRGQYRYFVVDEFQDVNPLQKLLLDAWLGDRDDLCVVGDPSQTIYSFAGATPGYLTGFAAGHPHATVVELVRDYRSTPQVVRVANHVISQARGSAANSHLTLRAQRPDGPDPLYQEYDDEPAEATGVARKIRVLMDSGGVPASEIAVLVRTNSQSAAYEQALTDEGVPFTVRGTARFFERPEIREAVHLLRGARHGAADDAGEDLVSGVRHLLTQLGLTETAPEGRQARERWESLSALAQLAEDMVATAGSRVTMAHFLEELEARMATEHAPGFEGVTIASLHSAKGLEWDAVFMCGLHEGMMPIIYAETDEQVEEERRLFYVGVTRAREHLSMSWSLSRSPGGRRTRKPSRFLDGLRPASPTTGARRDRRNNRVVRCRVCGVALTEAAERKLGRCSDCPSTYDEALLERMRHWRLLTSRAQSVPAYVVFTDATLQAIAEQEPSSLEQLSTVSGVGAQKRGRYGEAVLALVRGADPEALVEAHTADMEDTTDD
ncbi:ATP-dependent DNA helicase UvrD2 [Nocardiopsis sp. HNM0947]|uniref:DNA 3'-5' helicase n=1 Tax=Nocardiopsis coralli TaxID=2772213 RepID=A0ABR9P7E4_9ACTN|nr:ATP-dependent DNA helicase UvrD2 [Nocardiopsis coralli]MBE2999775.1 ATP-dependent DNA helicase UvrD2 [Nocardiopsis coralli]